MKKLIIVISIVIIVILTIMFIKSKNVYTDTNLNDTSSVRNVTYAETVNEVSGETYYEIIDQDTGETIHKIKDETLIQQYIDDPEYKPEPDNVNDDDSK